mmetsp:Transcript_6891/g.17628  ORF Transcript_6891/g.17628 Transcript_6891/m.17628 type:complete len:244 (+) Transcript_6891:72-803(+)
MHSSSNLNSQVSESNSEPPKVAPFAVPMAPAPVARDAVAPLPPRHEGSAAAPRVGHIAVSRSGDPLPHVVRLNHEVFGSDVDRQAWSERMLPGQSWLVFSRDGFIAAHMRGSDVNVWLAGVRPTARRSGQFRRLLEALLAELPWTTPLTMTTFPDKFPVMFALLTAGAQRCDEPADTAKGKARFRAPVWQIVLMVRRRQIALASLCIVGLASAAVLYLRRDSSDAQCGAVPSPPRVVALAKRF